MTLILDDAEAEALRHVWDYIRARESETTQRIAELGLATQAGGMQWHDGHVFDSARLVGKALKRAEQPKAA